MAQPGPLFLGKQHQAQIQGPCVAVSGDADDLRLRVCNRKANGGREPEPCSPCVPQPVLQGALPLSLTTPVSCWGPQWSPQGPGQTVLVDLRPSQVCTSAQCCLAVPRPARLEGCPRHSPADLPAREAAAPLTRPTRSAEPAEALGATPSRSTHGWLCVCWQPSSQLCPDPRRRTWTQVSASPPRGGEDGRPT